MSQFLTTEQAANFLELSRRTLETWRTNGGGPGYVKLGRAVRYHETDLVKFAEQGRRNSTSDPGGTNARRD
jgi:excisionase family DNA binding protein